MIWPYWISRVSGERTLGKTDGETMEVGLKLLIAWRVRISWFWHIVKAYTSVDNRSKQCRKCGAQDYINKDCGLDPNCLLTVNHRYIIHCSRYPECRRAFNAKRRCKLASNAARRHSKPSAGKIWNWIIIDPNWSRGIWVKDHGEQAFNKEYFTGDSSARKCKEFRSATLAEYQ